MILQDLEFSIYRKKGKLGCLEKGREIGSRMWYLEPKKVHVQGVTRHLSLSHSPCLQVQKESGNPILVSKLVHQTSV